MSDLVRVRRALLSVSDKTGLVELARGLHKLGIELLSTGGSAKALRDAGLPVRTVEDVTSSPEMLGGRVKTLHPKIHGGILARRDIDGPTLIAQGIEPIDLVCVNLYPLEKTIAKPGIALDDAIEQIDIGGPSMIRSAAKNSQWVVCVIEPEQYQAVLDELRTHDGSTRLSLRRDFAQRAFVRTSQYDAAIAGFLAQADSTPTKANDNDFPDQLDLGLVKLRTLRYGENPHQPAALYRSRAHTAGPSVITAEQHHGKPMSYNNMLDAAAALRLAADLHSLCAQQATSMTYGAVVVKHTNPCGAAIAPNQSLALRHALDGDPLASFGGIIATTHAIDQECAEMLAAPGAFFEVIVAPCFEPDALETLRARFANVRLIEVGELGAGNTTPTLEVRTIAGGALVQHADNHVSDPSQWKLCAGPMAEKADLQAAAFLDVVVRALTSNAIAIGQRTGDGSDNDSVSLVGAGAGQMDRVASCRIAIEKAGERANGALAASDAFFPFPDGPALLIEAGVGLIVQPGGSKRDSETFELCARHSVCCLTTGVRRFRH